MIIEFVKKHYHIIIDIIVLLTLFTFFRYEYIYKDTSILKIDRLRGKIFSTASHESWNEITEIKKPKPLPQLTPMQRAEQILERRGFLTPFMKAIDSIKIASDSILKYQIQRRKSQIISNPKYHPIIRISDKTIEILYKSKRNDKIFEKIIEIDKKMSESDSLLKETNFFKYILEH